jgi:hypothetical protein
VTPDIDGVLTRDNIVEEISSNDVFTLEDSVSSDGTTTSTSGGTTTSTSRGTTTSTSRGGSEAGESNNTSTTGRRGRGGFRR